MVFRKAISLIPQVKSPSTDIGPRERVKWTIAAAVAFLLLEMVPSYLQYGIHSISILTSTIPLIFLGIGPIILVVEALHILLKLGILRLDLGKTEDRALFYGMQKILVFVTALFESFALVIGFRLAEGAAGVISAMLTLAVGVIILMYLDEIVIKWGIGSGLGLFLTVGAFKGIFSALLIAPNELDKALLFEVLDSWRPYDHFKYELLLPFLIAAVVAAIVFYAFGRKTYYRVSTEYASGRFGINYFYVSAIALYSTAYSLFFYFVPKEVSYKLHALDGLLLPSRLAGLEVSSLATLLVFVSISILLTLGISMLFSKWLYGLNKVYIQPRRQLAIKFEEGGEKGMEQELNRMILASSVVIVLLSIVTDMMGSILSFYTILIVTGYLYRVNEEIKGPAKMCPSCGSRGIEWLLPGIWSIWECRNCGYRGTLVIEEEKKAGNIPDDIIKWIKHVY
jgi:preprotein translocase subunit SecY